MRTILLLAHSSKINLDERKTEARRKMEGKKIIRRVNSYGNIQYNRREYFIGEEEIGTEVELIVNRGIAVMARQAGRSWQRLVESPKSTFKKIKRRIRKVTVNEDSLYKLLSITDKALKQTDRNAVLLVDNKVVIRECAEQIGQLRMIVEGNSVLISKLYEEIKQIRSIQSHKGVNLFFLNTSNIKTGFGFFKRLFSNLNILQSIPQLIRRGKKMTNQSLSSSLNDIKITKVNPVLSELVEVKTSNSLETKIHNSLNNKFLIHKTQNTKSQAKRKSKKPFIGGNN